VGVFIDEEHTHTHAETFICRFSDEDASNERTTGYYSMTTIRCEQAICHMFSLSFFLVISFAHDVSTTFSRMSIVLRMRRVVILNNEQTLMEMLLLLLLGLVMITKEKTLIQFDHKL
jgi:hypothetical protein